VTVRDSFVFSALITTPTRGIVAWNISRRAPDQVCIGRDGNRPCSRDCPRAVARRMEETTFNGARLKHLDSPDVKQQLPEAAEGSRVITTTKHVGSGNEGRFRNSRFHCPDSLGLLLEIFEVPISDALLFETVQRLRS
jgi:hypothetical protein